MVYLKLLLVPQGTALLKKNTSWQSNKKRKSKFKCTTHRQTCDFWQVCWYAYWLRKVLAASHQIVPTCRMISHVLCRQYVWKPINISITVRTVSCQYTPQSLLGIIFRIFWKLKPGYMIWKKQTEIAVIIQRGLNYIPSKTGMEWSP